LHIERANRCRVDLHTGAGTRPRSDFRPAPARAAIAQAQKRSRKVAPPTLAARQEPDRLPARASWLRDLTGRQVFLGFDTHNLNAETERTSRIADTIASSRLACFPVELGLGTAVRLTERRIGPEGRRGSRLGRDADRELVAVNDRCAGPSATLSGVLEVVL
jgi:hypothetical protein